VRNHERKNIKFIWDILVKFKIMQEKILLPEQFIKQKKLIEEKKQNKEIVDHLQFLIENDQNVNDNFYIDRQKQVKEKINNQIKEIKNISYEKVVNIHLRYRLAQNILSQIPCASELTDRLEIRNNESQNKIIKHTDKYDINLPEKNNEFKQNSEEIFQELNEAVDKQGKIAETLQDLLVSDDEFREEYIELLNQASKNLSAKERGKDILALNKAEEVLTGLPFSSKFLGQITELKEKIEQINQEEKEVLEERVDWEILPAGEKPIGLFAPKNKHENEWNDLKNEERLEYIKNLGPDAIYSMASPVMGRDYEMYQFSNCIVLASVWARHAVYIMPKENLKELAQKDKMELKFRGAIQLKNIPGWQEKLENILTGDINIEVDLDKSYQPRIQESWGDDPEKWKQKVRNAIFLEYPEIALTIKQGDNDRAKQLLKNILSQDMSRMRISTAIWKFGSRGNALINSFLEAKLTKEDFPVKKYKWKNATKEKKRQNIRNAISENLPEVDQAIKNGELEEAAEWLSILKDEDFKSKAFGLGYIASGKDNYLRTRKVALIKSYPELKNLKDLFRKGRRYKDKNEKLEKWGERFRNVLLEQVFDLENTVKSGNLKQAKLLILKTLNEAGASNFVDKHIKSIRGVKEISEMEISGCRRYLMLAFPEISWSDISFQKGPRK